MQIAAAFSNLEWTPLTLAGTSKSLARMALQLLVQKKGSFFVALSNFLQRLLSHLATVSNKQVDQGISFALLCSSLQESYLLTWPFVSLEIDDILTEGGNAFDDVDRDALRTISKWLLESSVSEGEREEVRDCF